MFVHHFLHNNTNAEVVAGIIENKLDAENYLTHTHSCTSGSYNISNSQLLLFTRNQSQACVWSLLRTCAKNIGDDMDLNPLNLGMIASYYYISYTTVEWFSPPLSSKTKKKGVLEGSIFSFKVCSTFQYSLGSMRGFIC